MKKESKGRYKTSEVLDSKTSALIMIASGVSVLLLIIYFGISLTSKGTFSAGSCSFSYQSAGNGYIYVSRSSDLCDCTAIGTDWEEYAIPSQGTYCRISSNNYRNDYILPDLETLQQSIPDNRIDGAVLNLDLEKVLIASTDIFTSFPFHCASYGYAEYTAGSTMYCAKDLSTHVNSKMSNVNVEPTTCTYSIIQAGTDYASAHTESQACCQQIGWTWNSSASIANCRKAIDSSNSGYYSYSNPNNANFTNWCATNSMYFEWNNKCIMCKNGYSPDNTYGCVESGNTSEPKTVTITFKNDDGSTVDTRSCTIPAGSNICPNDIIFPGAAVSVQHSDYTFSGWGDVQGCTTGTYAANDTLHITRDSRNQTYYACYNNQAPATSSSAFNISSCSYSPWRTVVRDQNHLDCIYTNITYGTNQGQSTTGDVQACCTQKNYTWVGANYTGGGSDEYCIICGSGSGQTINQDRCIKSQGEIKRVVSCDLTAEQVAGISCNGSNTATAQGMCTLSDGTRVPRCDVADVTNTHCSSSSSSSSSITCYYCDSNNTKRTYTSDTGSCNNSNYPAATTNSNLVCTSETTTCYRCTADSTAVDEDEFDGTSCPSGWSKTRPSTCAKSCDYCEIGSKATDTNVPKLVACSDYRSNYYEVSENINCSTVMKTCYKCTANSTAVSEQQVIESDNCPSGWSTERPSTCAKSCDYCDGETKKTTANNVPKLKACSSASSSWHETTENLDCSKDTCYKCNANSTSPDTQQVNKGDSCPSGWSKTVPTCAKTCNYCENGTKKTTDNIVPKLKACSSASSSWHEITENLDCSPAKTYCYYCEGESRKRFELETAANGNCANSTAHPGASSDSNLICVEEVKCCACDGTTKVTKGNSTNKVCPAGQTICGELVCKNVQTGTSAIVIAWLVGIMAIGYSFYYFRRTNKQQ